MCRRLGRMTGAFTCIVCLVAMLAAAGPVAAGIPSLVFEPRGDTLSIRINGQPFATYVYRDAVILRPYFKDVYAPGGVQVTRRHPPKEGTDPTDHDTMHPGLWLAFGDLGGSDFWRNKAKVEHVEFVESPHVEKEVATFAVRNRYIGGQGTVVCEETCKYSFRVRPTGYLILWDSVFQSDRAGFYFGDQEEMGLGVRVATPLIVKPYKEESRPGRILDDQNRRNEKQIWGRPAAWCDYSGWIGATFAGIMVMPDPRNVAVCRWHTRDYGFMAANPFGQSVFKAGPERKTPVDLGRPFHLRFGILVHAAGSEEGVDLAAAYRDYLEVAVRN